MKTYIMKKNVIKENKIIVENGVVKTILSEQTIKSGYMPIEEARRLSIERLNKRWEIINQK